MSCGVLQSNNLFLIIFTFFIGRWPISRDALYNPPENKSEITNNDQTCATTIKNKLNPGFYHIKYDETYMPELFLTLPELPNKQHDQLLMICWIFFLTILHKRLKQKTNHKYQNYQCTTSRTSGMVPGLCKHYSFY